MQNIQMPQYDMLRINRYRGVIASGVVCLVADDRGADYAGVGYHGADYHGVDYHGVEYHGAAYRDLDHQYARRGLP